MARKFMAAVTPVVKGAKAKRRMKHYFMLVLFVASGSVAHALDIDPEAEKRSLFPLIPESTYSYNWVFKDRKGTDVLVLKKDPLAGTDVFYFVLQQYEQNPNAIIGPTSIGLGLYLKATDGIASVNCFSRNLINTFDKKNLDTAVTIIKEAAPDGTVIDTPVGKDSSHTYRVAGHEDVTVPAGSFKDCLKLTILETYVKVPPEKNVVYTATAWLAKGVGVVKWVRGTGRIDELAAYKFPEIEKK